MPETNRNLEECLLCNTCAHETRHGLIAKHSFSIPYYIGTEREWDVDQHWELFQCLGCNQVTVRVTTDLPSKTRKFYPERVVVDHQKKEYQKLPANLDSLYTEVVNAINNNLLLLCAAGLRALLEGLCADKGITEGPNEHGKIAKTLEGRINGLTTIVPVGIVRNLHGLRFLGNQALHELEVPSKGDLELGLGVIEDIFNVVYDLDYKSELLYKKATRPRLLPETEEEPEF